MAFLLYLEKAPVGHSKVLPVIYTDGLGQRAFRTPGHSQLYDL
jgi:hypothetical protein